MKITYGSTTKKIRKFVAGSNKFVAVENGACFFRRRTLNLLLAGAWRASVKQKDATDQSFKFVEIPKFYAQQVAGQLRTFVFVDLAFTSKLRLPFYGLQVKC
jgi:hypothetical protein